MVTTTGIGTGKHINDRYRLQTKQLDMPPRLLLGPGPANVNPRVLAAMGISPVGHLDPTYLALMDEIRDLLRYAWQTENELTIAVAGTGSDRQIPRPSTRAARSYEDLN